MSSLKRTALGLLAVMAASAAARLLRGKPPRESIAVTTTPVDVARLTPGKAPPLPAAGPLATPRSMRQVGLPADLVQKATPSDNPQTAEKIALGKKLFFDGRLSADGSVSCATCHDPARAFTDGR